MAVKTSEVTKEPVTVDEWKEMIPVRLPKARDGEDKSMYVAVNGIAYWVPKGIKVDVPKPIYERIMLAQIAEEGELDMREHIPNEA